MEKKWGMHVPNVLFMDGKLFCTILSRKYTWGNKHWVFNPENGSAFGGKLCMRILVTSVREEEKQYFRADNILNTDTCTNATCTSQNGLALIHESSPANNLNFVRYPDRKLLCKYITRYFRCKRRWEWEWKGVRKHRWNNYRWNPFIRPRIFDARKFQS